MAVEENITISAVGGDDAAAEITKASQALDNTATSSGRLQEQFQHSFQHIGLKLFAQDALRASGLGGEARMAINLLNMALTEGAAAAGISSGGVMLVVAALGALAAAAYKVIEHQKSMVEQSEKLIEADTKHLTTIREKISGLESLEQATGNLNIVQREYLEDLKKIGAEAAEQKNAHLIEDIALQNQVIEKGKEQLAALKEEEVVEQRAAASGVQLSTGTAAGIKKVTAEIEKATSALKADSAEMDALHKTGTGSLKDLEKANEDAAKNQDDIWKKYWEDVAKYDEESHKKIEKNLQEQAALVKQVSGQIGGDLGNAFAHSLVEGKKFTDELKAAFTRMAEQMIADMVKMAIEAAALSAAGLPMGGVLGGAGGVIGKLFGGGFASGGEVMVDKPTLFLAGEAGPERATFTPMGAPSTGSQATSSGGGGGDIYIHIENNVSGVQDPSRFAESVGRKIIEQIRGAGQLSFART